MRRALIALALLSASPVLAAEHGGEEKAGKEAVGQYVDISVVALPVIWKGKLMNYVFVGLRINLNKGADAVALREKEPYFRDALVRGAHRTPFTDPHSFTKLDEAALKRFMMQEGARIAGAKAIANIQIVTAQPQRVSGLPKPG
jgi:hypothetical protein